MNTDQNPEAAPADNPAQTTTNLSVALSPPPAQAPPAGGEQDQEHDQEQETAASLANPERSELSTVVTTLEPLSGAEQGDLTPYEEVVARGRRAFMDLGLALGRIRDLRLYRAEFNTFEDYCREKWHYGRRYANHLISAARVSMAFLPGQQKPEHESQVRPLVGLAPEQIHLAWARAAQKAGGGRITGRLVQKAVDEIQSRAQPASAAPPVRQNPRSGVRA